MVKKYLVDIKRKDGITQGYWITKKVAKKRAKYELWKDGTLRRVVRNKKGHFVTWKIVPTPEPESYIEPIWIEEEEQYWEISFDFRPEKES